MILPVLPGSSLTRSGTAIIFTSDHGFYFGEHGGRFGEMCYARRLDGLLYRAGDPDGRWTHSPLYEEPVHIPLLPHAPGIPAGEYSGQTSALDLTPTILEIFEQPVPNWVEGRSLLPAAQTPQPKATTMRSAHTRP